MEIDERTEKMKEIQDKVTRGLLLNRVPRRTKQDFIAWAKDEFDDDWGFALKWLMDFKNGVLTSQNELLLEQIGTLTEQVQELQKEVNAMKTNQPQEQKKVIKSVSGNVIREE